MELTNLKKVKMFSGMKKPKIIFFYNFRKSFSQLESAVIFKKNHSNYKEIFLQKEVMEYLGEMKRIFYTKK